MLQPNISIATVRTEEYALHRFPGDKRVMLCLRHKCGDWQTIRFATDHEVEWFKQYGTPPKK